MQTKPAIVLRVGQPPVVEQLPCDVLSREPSIPSWPKVPVVRDGELYRLIGQGEPMVEFVRPIPAEVRELEAALGVKLLVTEGCGFEVKLVVHESGRLLRLPVNERATRLYPGRHMHKIYGDAVLVEVD